MHQYFAYKLKNNRVYLTDQDKHHILNVIQLMLYKNHCCFWSSKFLAEIQQIDPLHVNIVQPLESIKAAPNFLYQASIKPANFEWLAQKCAELGVLLSCSNVNKLC